ncbi:hypothetical protein FCL47_22480 [Desulfopila sp. IMCC35006]|uniref:hypothetical protein n=1 Tax=Desulfopila sp. IMCC35006 TaxID=2569542 RepID=UPI0010ACF32D|nr:hypothetical protein [Desulfopila sp. IMCC35006]TKB23522.1 hypothetical protein FCL47_22480 [Desulfopila sp. IMCC35006]
MSYPYKQIDDFCGFSIEVSEQPGWVVIRHPRTQAVVDSCLESDYKKVVKAMFELPEDWDMDRG